MSLLKCSLTTSVSMGHTLLVYMSYSTIVWIYKDRKQINWFAEDSWHSLREVIEWPSTCTVTIIASDLIKQTSEVFLPLFVKIENYNIFVLAIIVNKVNSV